MRIRSIIFDFNGVLVDDERVHFQAFEEALGGQGLKLSWEEYCDRYLHYDDHDFFRHFLRDRGAGGDPDLIEQLIRSKSRHYFSRIEESVPAIGHSVEFVGRLPAETCLAIASGAARAEILFILPRLGLKDRFQFIVSADDVTQGKPHPETYLKALKGLQERFPTLTPPETLIIEDSCGGIESARAAGLRCLALTTNYPRDRLADADLVLESLEGWDIPRLEAAIPS